MNDAHQQDMADLAAQEAEDRDIRVRAAKINLANGEAHAVLEASRADLRFAMAEAARWATALAVMATVVTLVLWVRASW